jgi:aspartyl-tRNA(Asn)/glutamyl-tRNA(Gln) amidotransferase subunit C
MCGNLTAFLVGIKYGKTVMSLERKDVEKIAHLARIAVEEAQLDPLAGDLSNILDLVEQMNAVDTQGVTPMAHPLHMSQRLRADAVSESDEREKFQSIAPLTEAGLYLVPRVVE